MVYAQHFGIPTRLLDFAFSPLISLMFAVEKAFANEDDEQSVVWLLNFKALNKYSVDKTEIVNLSMLDKDDTTVDKMKYLCAVTARKLNPRVIAQNGLFVLFKQDSKPLDESVIASKVLRKIVIPHSCSKKILSDLYAVGMRFNKLYPELSSISRDILLKNDVTEYYEMEDIKE